MNTGDGTYLRKLPTSPHGLDILRLLSNIVHTVTQRSEIQPISAEQLFSCHWSYVVVGLPPIGMYREYNSVGLFSVLPVNSGESSEKCGDARLTLRNEHELEYKHPIQRLWGDDEAILPQRV